MSALRALSAGSWALLHLAAEETGRPGVGIQPCTPAPHSGTWASVCVSDTALRTRLRRGPLHTRLFLWLFKLSQCDVTATWFHHILGRGWGGGGDGDRKEGVSGEGAFFRAGRDLQKHPEAHLHGTPALHSRGNHARPLMCWAWQRTVFLPSQRRALSYFTPSARASHTGPRGALRPQDRQTPTKWHPEHSGSILSAAPGWRDSACRPGHCAWPAGSETVTKAM